MHQYLLDPPSTIIRLIEVEVLCSIEGPHDMARNLHGDQGSQFQWLAQLQFPRSHYKPFSLSRRGSIARETESVGLRFTNPTYELQQVKDATQMADKMRQTLFKDSGVGLVHGRMKVEVGIDIPNATVMVIEHAERFGLSQLHQLRGRVGRGQSPGYCFLVSRGTASSVAAERLRVIAEEKGGFKIAEADLKLSGAGELLGTRQSGSADFRLASLTRDTQLLIAARQEALAWLENAPQLKSKDSAGMREILKHRWGKRLQLGAVG